MRAIFHLLLAVSQRAHGLPVIGDLCKRDNPCVSQAQCVIDPAAPVVGRPFCVCEPGLAGDGRRDGTGCTDIDECADNTHNCLPNAERCINTYGGFECQCRAGYSKRPRESHCHDINECIDSMVCGDPDSTCVNIPGSFICACNDPNKEYVGGRCMLKDFCQDPDYNLCDRRNGICVNGINGAECLCKPGYQLGEDGYSCTDINECETGESNCPEDISECINEPGGYRCECSERRGWTNAGPYECANLNECEMYPDVCGELSCCKDMLPPKKYLCSEIIPDSPSNREEGATQPVLLQSMNNLFPNLRKFVQRPMETFASTANAIRPSTMLSPGAGDMSPSYMRHLNQSPEFGELLEMAFAQFPEQQSYSAAAMPRQLEGVADHVVRYTLETASNLVPALTHDAGSCPYGFTDLRPLRRRQNLSKVPEASSKILSWLRDASPIKLHEVENMEAAAVAVGLAQNAKNIVEQMTEWYTALAAVPAALEAAGSKSEGLDFTRDVGHIVSLLQRATAPFKEAVATVKSIGPPTTSDLSLPVAAD